MGQAGAMGKCQLCDSHINGRLRNTPKYEEVYLKVCTCLREAKRDFGTCFRFYDTGWSCQTSDFGRGVP